MDSIELNAPGYEIPPEIKGQIAITSLDRIKIAHARKMDHLPQGPIGKALQCLPKNLINRSRSLAAAKNQNSLASF